MKRLDRTLGDVSLFDVTAERLAYETGRNVHQVRSEVQGARHCPACGYAHQGECRPGDLFAREDERERKARK